MTRLGQPSCPCCGRDVVAANELPKPVAPATPGDLYCTHCSWFFAKEMLGEQDPAALRRILRCPTHEPKRRPTRLGRAWI